MNVPLAGEAGRRFYRQRIALVGTLSSVAQVAFLLMCWLWLDEPFRFGTVLSHYGTETVIWQITLSLAPALLGQVVRLRDWPPTAVLSFDVVATWLQLTGITLNCFVINLGEPPEMMAMLGASNVLVGRAALIPSSAQRTLSIGVLVAGPMVPLTYLRYPDLAHDLALTKTINVSYWCGLTLFASTVISHIIFRLALRVEAARKLGQYTLDDKIGEGGMGEVYRARHAFLRRPTAVKLLREERSDARDIARFEREVQLTSQLTHPNTIQIYDFGRADDGTFYYAMEYIDGLTLAELVEAYGAQPPGRVAKILADVCGSLAEAHAAGLVHRDIKPHNIMVCKRSGLYDQVKVLDFGLVRTLDHQPDGGSESSLHVVGTPGYMAPEAFRSPESVDARTDIYAIGAVGYLLLTGAHAYSGDSPFAVLANILYSEPVRISQRRQEDVPAALEALLHACMASSASERPQTALELGAALSAIAQREPALDLAAWWKEHEATPHLQRRAYSTPESRLLTAARNLES